jgi:hypothetical protein
MSKGIALQLVLISDKQPLVVQGDMQTTPYGGFRFTGHNTIDSI